MREKFGSLLSSLMVGFVIVVLGGLLCCQLQQHRELARKAICGDNLKRLGLAMHNYHDAYARLPYGSGGTDVGGVNDAQRGNASRLSGIVSMLPFFEQQLLYDRITSPRDGFPPMGPVPWYDPQEFKPWGERPEMLICPADPNAADLPLSRSYAFCYGDSSYEAGAPFARAMAPYQRDLASKRGMFAREHHFAFRDILDGLSNTIMISEMQVGGKAARGIAGIMAQVEGIEETPAVLTKVQQPKWHATGRGSLWCDGALHLSGFLTILPPNSKSGTAVKGPLSGVVSASSHHPGGVHILRGDGSTQFLSETIDAGDATQPGVAAKEGFSRPGSESPYGMWGALGTRASREVIDLPPGLLGPPVEPLSEATLAAIAEQPLRSWTDAKGNAKLKARFVRVVDQTAVEVMTEDDRFKRIPLSHLRSEDAYFAVEKQLEREQQQKVGLDKTIRRGIELLEQKKFRPFIDELVKIPAQVDKDELDEAVQQFAQMRGVLLQQLDDAANRGLQPENDDTFRPISNQQVAPRIRFVREGDAWKIDFN